MTKIDYLQDVDADGDSVDEESVSILPKILVEKTMRTKGFGCVFFVY